MSPQTQADLLTRTTFQLNNVSSPLVLGQLIGVLHRVPGVLFAEIAPGADRAIVAHDAAVSSASLVDAAARTGVRLKLVSDTRPTVTIGGAPQLVIDTSIRNLVAFAALIALVPYFLGAISPRLAGNHLVLPIVLGCFGRSSSVMRCSAVGRSIRKNDGPHLLSAELLDGLRHTRIQRTVYTCVTYKSHQPSSTCGSAYRPSSGGHYHEEDRARCSFGQARE